MANIITAPESGIYFDGNTAGVSSIPTLTGDASGVAIQYDGYAGVEINSSATGVNYLDRFSVEGANGRLFGVTDEVTGTVFSVNDAAGLPIIEVESTADHDKITIGEYGTNALVVSGDSVGIGTTSPSQKLDVQGTILVNNEIQLVDSNMRIFRSSNDLRLRTGGSDRVTINSTGNVGIGTTSPASLLNVVSSGNGTTALTVQDEARKIKIGRDSVQVSDLSNTATTLYLNSGGGNVSVPVSSFTVGATGPDSGVKLQVTGHSKFKGDSYHSHFNYGSSQDTYIRGGKAGSLVYINDLGTSDVGMVAGGGNVGIGTNSPDFKLDVAGDIGIDDKIYHNGDHNTYISLTSDTQTFRTGGTDRVTINNTGVGIGTASPQAKLQVSTANQNTFALAIGNDSYTGGHPRHELLMLNNGSLTWYLPDNGSTPSKFQFYSRDTATYPFTIDSDTANVGIGTTSPAKTLDIVGEIRTSGRATFNEYVNTNLVYGTTDLNLGYAGGTSGIFIKGSGALAGNVGIGTVSPENKLHILTSTTDTSSQLMVQNGSTGDAAIKFNISGQSYVIGIDNSDANKFKISGSSSLGTYDRLTIDTSGNATFAGDVVVSGGLTVNGTTTTINSTTVQVDDKNIELGTVATPTDTTADGGGITLKGATDKTINWYNATDAWTFSHKISTSEITTASGTLTLNPAGTYINLPNGKKLYGANIGFGYQANAVSALQFYLGASIDNPDIKLHRDGAAQLALRNGSASQEFRVYNTHTDASNYERGYIGWDSNVLEIGSEKLGTGSLRSMKINSALSLTLQSNSNGQIKLLSSGNTGIVLESTGSHTTIKRSASATTSFNHILNLQSTGSGGLILQSRSVSAVNYEVKLASTGSYTKKFFFEASSQAGGQVGTDMILKAGSNSGAPTLRCGDLYLAGQNSSGSGRDGNIIFLHDSTNSSNGNVGIGTTSPSERLHIHNSTGNGATIRLSDPDSTSTANATGYVEVYHGEDTSRAGYFGLITNSEMALATTTSAGKIRFYTANNTTALTIDSSQNIEAVGSVTAYSFIKDGGANSEFLKADGSVDSNTYASSSALSSYLPLAGGTLTGNVTFPSPDAINFVADSDTGESHGITARRTWKKTVTAGNLQKLGKWTDTEGTVQMLITVGSETGGNSGTSTYLWGGGFSSISTGGYRRLRPITDHNGHGNGPDNGTNDSWHVYLKQETSYVYSISVAVPTGANNKNLRVTCVELAGGNNFTDMSSDSALAMSGLSFGADQFSLKNITASSVTATSLIKSGGSSSEFLKADGSVDSNTYLTTSSASSTYLPLAGGTMTGAIVIPSGTITMSHASIGSQTSSITSVDGNKLKLTSSFTVGAVAGNSIYLDAPQVTLSGSSSGGSGLVITASATPVSNNTTLHIGDSFSDSIGITGRARSVSQFFINRNIASPTGKLIDFQESGTSRFLIDSSGNVGIGTVNPTAKITLADHTTAAGGIKFRSAASTVSLFSNGSGNLMCAADFNSAGRIRVVGGNAAADPDFGFKQGIGGGMGFSRAGDDITFITDSTEQMRLDSSGNVGIGTTGPSDKLEVYANGADVALRIHEDAGTHQARLHLRRGGSDWEIINDGHLTIEGEGTERMRITTAGNVGIGTTSPSAKLQVVGTVQAWTPAGDAYSIAGAGATDGNYRYAGLRFDRTNNVAKFGHYLNSGLIEKGFVAVADDGNVGIGTNNPTSILDIRDTQTGAASEIKLFNLDQGNTTTQTSALVMSPDVRANGVKIAAVKENADFSSSANKDVAITFSPVLNNAAAEKMRITSAGNVGIGTNNPSSKFDIAFADNSEPIRFSYAPNAGGYNLTLDTEIPAGGVVRYHWHLTNNGTSYDDILVLDRGNVGIGTASPAYKLDVNGEVRSDAYRIDLSATTQRALSSTGTDSLQVGDAGVNDIKFKNAAGNSVIIASSGNVGIGTTSPSQKLHVVGNTTTTGVSYTDIVQTYSGSSIDFRHQDASVIMRVDTANARVGIGTTSPSANYKLHVAGGIKSTNFLDFNNNYGVRCLNTSNSAVELIKLNSSNQLQIGSQQSNSNPTLISGSYITLEPTNFLGIPVEAVRVIDGGNVGIGTTSPSTTLDVDGITTSDAFRTNTSNTDYNVISRNSTSTTLWVQAAQSGSLQGIASFRYGSSTVNAGTEVCAIRRNSSYFINTKLGIGTNNPGKTLDVSGEVRVSNGDLEVVGSSEGIILTAPSGGRYRISVNDSGELQTSAV